MIAARVRDRVRPWAAPPAPVGAPQVVVVGSGAAGLASAAVLRRHGADAVVVDRRHAIGGAWPDRYDSLRLNTVRWMSDLPGLPMPRSLGRWVGRDSVVEYLQQYVEHHRLDVRLGTEVTEVEPLENGWALRVAGERETVAGLVIATGHSAQPVVPEWEGSFDGRLLHAAEYRRPSDHEGRRVVVVGAGSSGGEICVDLAAAGVDVTWSVRTAPRVFPREVRGVPTTPFAPPADALPDRWVDRMAPRFERLIYGRRDYLPEPSESMMRLLARCKEPMTADGIVSALRAGSVRVVAAVESLEADGVRLADGSSVAADEVIAATGYRPGLEPLVGHLDVLDGAGRPTALMPRPGLAFIGFRIPLTGTLWAIGDDSRRAGRSMAADLAPAAVGGAGRRFRGRA